MPCVGSSPSPVSPRLTSLFRRGWARIWRFTSHKHRREPFFLTHLPTAKLASLFVRSLHFYRTDRGGSWKAARKRGWHSVCSEFTPAVFFVVDAEKPSRKES